MNKVFIDTNILIYTLDESSEFHKRADTLLRDASLNLLTCTKNISEYFAVCSKLKVDKKKCFGFYQDIKNNIEILYPTPGSLERFEHLLEKYDPKGNQVFDMEMVSIMLENSLEDIATINKKDFEHISEIRLFDF